MDNKQQEFTKQTEFTDLMEFIEISFGIELQPFQVAYLKHLIDDNSVYVGGNHAGKTVLWEKYLEFKRICS